MVQSSDLVRISTVQSTDFMEQSSDLAEDLSKSSSRSEEFILFVWVSVWCLDRLPFTQSLSSNCPTVTADGVSEIIQNTDLNRLGWTQTGLCQINSYFLFYSSYHEILHIFGVKSSDFPVNPWVNPQIVWISLNPWIYQIYLGVFNILNVLNLNSL